MENFTKNNMTFEIDYEFMLETSLVEQKVMKENLNLFQKLFNKLNNIFKKENENFAELCYVIYQIKQLFDNYRYKRIYIRSTSQESTSYFFKDIMIGFGLDDTQVSRILSCYEKFVIVDNGIANINSLFENFSKSKLFELLLVDNNQLEKDIKNKVLRSDMSVDSIRKYVKNYKAIQNMPSIKNVEKQREEFKEEDIPLAYNPKQHYEFSYFEEKTKAQLLNIVWELQKEYEKLKGKK